MAHIFSLSQGQRDKEFALFRAGDACIPDLVARHAVVLTCGIALWFATQRIIMLVWAFGYLLLNMLYVSYLNKQSGPVSTSSVPVTAAWSIGIAMWYGAMVIYIATLSDGDFLILAACGVVGAALHSLSQNRELSISAYVDLLAVLLPAIGVAFVAAMIPESFGIGLATLLGALCVIGYFVLAFHQIMSDRMKLKERMLADVQDQKMRALGQLTSGVAHDFNNLLAIVIANLELSQQDDSNDDNVKYLNEAQIAAESGANLVKQLMAYVRQSNLRTQDVFVDEVLARLAAVVPRVLPAHIKFQLTRAESSLGIQCDPAMLETAVLNLIINARDAIGETEGEIQVAVVPEPQSGMMNIRVTDTGPGMESDTLEQASEPFFTTKSFGQGSGLGLSMVKGFAEQSGGELTLRNRPSGGLAANLALPIGNVSAAITLERVG